METAVTIAGFAPIAEGQATTPAACPPAAALDRLSALGAPNDAAVWRELARILRLRPSLSAADRRRGCQASWYRRVVRTWPASARGCAVTVIGYDETMSCRDDYRDDECGVDAADDIPTPPHFGHFAAIDVDARGRLLVASRSLAANDLMVLSDPALPDLDGDGWPEWIEWSIPDDPSMTRLCGVAADSCGGRYCASCGLPDERFFSVIGSRSRARVLGPLLGAGRVVESEVDRRLEAALAPHRARSDIDSDYRMDACPEPDVSWTRLEYQGPPSITVAGGHVEISIPVLTLQCRGWESAPGDSEPTCVPAPTQRPLGHELPWPPAELHGE